MNTKTLSIVATAVLLSFYVATKTVLAQTPTSWAQCPSGNEIVRCQTFDCPLGDTNKDGICDLKDEKARLTDARNDALCANPTSGCGQVNYFPSGSDNACSVRVKENNNNCNLYKAADPKFALPTPSPSPSLQPVASPKPSPSAPPEARELPDTGPGKLAVLAFMGMFVGLTLKRALLS